MRWPHFLARGLVAAFVLVGAQACSIGPSGGTGGSSSSSTTAATLGATVATKVTGVTPQASHGQIATLQLTGTPGATCSIKVNYKSGPSKAKSLHPVTADSSGRVSWMWKVGSRTTAGTWAIDVNCDPGGAARAQFTVP